MQKQRCVYKEIWKQYRTLLRRLWIKWITKNEIKLVQRQIEMNDKELDNLMKTLPD